MKGDLTMNDFIARNQAAYYKESRIVGKVCSTYQYIQKEH